MACQKDVDNSVDIVANEISFKSGSKISLLQESLKAGIYQIDAELYDNKIIYTTKIAHTSMLNGNKVDFSNFAIELSNGKLILDNDYSIFRVDGDLFLSTPLYSGFMKDGNDDKLIDTKTAALILFYNEISENSKNIEKKTYSVFLNQFDKEVQNITSKSTLKKAGIPFITRGCGMNHAIKFGFSASSAELSLKTELRETRFYEGCVVVTPIEVSCYTDKYICVATQTFYCKTC
ncbi:hypothetical protein HMPREF0765_3060 [Sphingobacterium spiritivorum ATCC 33300]|uniref:Uncharacterized protein n=1 Tax=Sphingobacterium spiritivorum ATCC 33300 TaxID=525372 RepID=C2G0G0_SPHSI|nr:hypothetical protein [Sphingobacterium spiritivorum]EEI91340.1 hypothetical protein HMPREF0765_3060 [Sphingobacterium spiritivorum ATCC 33300]QQS97442.1 hypothetical protein I6J03_06965 [Sphingobacterium spiritivorum]